MGAAGGAEIAEVVKLLLKDRQQQDAELRDEQHRRSVATEQLSWEAQMQLVLLRQLVEGLQPRSEGGVRRSECKKARLAKLTDHDDIDAYLTTFECTMVGYKVSRDRWVYELAPQLSGRAQQAYAAMTPEEAGGYEKVKRPY